MNKILKRLGLMLCVAIVLVSCSADRSREEKIAAMINEVDSPFLIANTVPKNLIEKSGALAGALPFTYEMLINFFIDENVTGIDYDTDIQLVVAKGSSFLPSFYGVFKLKNEAVFIELLEKEANAEVKQKDGFKYIIKASDLYVIVWNEEFAVASNISVDFTDMFSGGGSKQGDKAVNKAIEMIKAGKKGDINETYASFLKNEADISMYFEGKGFYAYLNDMAMGNESELAESKELIEGFNCELQLNFKEGSIDLGFITHIADNVKGRFAFFNTGAVSEKLLNFGSTEGPLASAQYNANIKQYLDFAKEQMKDGEYKKIEDDLDRFGLTVEDIKKAMTGEFVFMLNRVDMREEIVDYGYGEPYTRQVPEPVFGIVAGISSKAIVEKALNESTIFGKDLYKNGDAFMYLSDDFLFASGDSLWTIQISEGKGVKIKDDQQVLTAKAFGLFVDFIKIATMEQAQEKQVKVFVDMLEAGTISGNMEEMTIRILFKDKSKNALRIITETVSNLGNSMNQGDQVELENELEEAVIEADLGELMEMLED